jgi:hypothetical protein
VLNSVGTGEVIISTHLEQDVEEGGEVTWSAFATQRLAVSAPRRTGPANAALPHKWIRGKIRGRNITA